VGTVVASRWRLKRLLGLGGLGAVYAASSADSPDRAVKMLHRDLAADADTRRRFLREAYLANEIEHPDVPRVTAHGEHDGVPYHLMELFDGLSVDRYARLAGGCLRPLDALEIVERLLDVLCVAHDRGIVHRDIKPSNLFRTRAPVRLKVLDFGIAGGVRHPTEVSALTADGAMLGTPQFMAPEHACGRWDEVDAQSDLWSAGATLFKLLTGRHVHERRTREEVFGAAMTSPAPRLSEVCVGMPASVCRVVDGALAFEKRKRFANARAMQAAAREAWEDVARAGDRPRILETGSSLGSCGGTEASTVLGSSGELGESPPQRAPEEGVLDTLAFARSGRVLVVAHTERAPPDEEWTRWMTRMSMHDYEHILITSSGGGPTPVQRKKTNQFWEGRELPRFSLLTESRAVVGIVSIFNWFLDNRLRAFRPDKTRDALDYLEVPPSERQALLDTASRLRLALGRQGAASRGTTARDV
jgi:eukaryotic-like serine/threonine-protein kinase